LAAGSRENESREGRVEDEVEVDFEERHSVGLGKKELRADLYKANG
jgi:hypothetical protein